MILKPWDSLPEEMKLPEVRPYYDLLQKKNGSLLLKRGFDIVFSAALLVLFSPLFGGLSLAIKLDSPGMASVFASISFVPWWMARIKGGVWSQ